MRKNDDPYCTLVHLQLPRRSRGKITGWVMIYFAISALLACSILRLWLWMRASTSPLDMLVAPISMMPLALLLGLVLGYALGWARDVLRGYVRVRWLDGSALWPPDPLMIAAPRMHVRVANCPREQTDGLSDAAIRQESARQSDLTRDVETYELLGMRGDTPVYGPADAPENAAVTPRWRLLLSLFSRQQVALYANGRRYEIWINERKRALIALVAVIKGSAKMMLDLVERTLYKGLREGTLHKDKSDIQREIREAAKRTDRTRSTPSLLRVRDGKGGYKDLGLSPDCVIEHWDRMRYWYQRMQAIGADPEQASDDPLGEARQAADYVMTAYGSGLCAENIAQDLMQSANYQLWGWAKESYLAERVHYYDCLKRCAGQEQLAGERSADSATRQECLRRERDLYLALLDACSRLYPDLKRCGAVRHHISRISEQLQDPATAETSGRRYRANLERWEALRPQMG